MKKSSKGYKMRKQHLDVNTTKISTYNPGTNRFFGFIEHKYKNGASRGPIQVWGGCSWNTM